MLVFPAVLTHVQAAQCAQTLKLAINNEQHNPVVADATGLLQFDSSALAVLLECRREALAKKLAFSVHGLPPRLQQLAGLYGVAALLPAVT